MLSKLHNSKTLPSLSWLIFLLNIFFLLNEPARPLVPVACILLNFLFILKVKGTSSRTLIFVLSLPLLIAASLITYKNLVAIPIQGFRPHDLNTYTEFISPQLEYLQEIAIYLIGVATFLFFTLIIILWTALSTVKRYIKIITLLILTPVQCVFFIMLLILPIASPSETTLQSEFSWKKDSIKKYFFSHGGANGSTGSKITQERPIGWGVKITKVHWRTQYCYDAKMKLVDNRILEIFPFDCDLELETSAHYILKEI